MKGLCQAVLKLLRLQASDHLLASGDHYTP